MLKILTFCCETIYVLCTGHVYNSVDGSGRRHHGQQQQQHHIDQVPVMRRPPDYHQAHLLYPSNASHFDANAAASSLPAFNVPTVPSAQGPSSVVLPRQSNTAQQLPQPQSFAVPGQVNVAPIYVAPGEFFYDLCIFMLYNYCNLLVVYVKSTV